ncbi:hypothetical protein QJS10_CPB14g01454 [Acorus calamus]|uniref:Uncharacterized protein n=1 Tax=Acorus calamus TaxID=4465 RepID=A0AAV9DDD9_ACOCL|nr:hypothetical protein QJS10_CPB14g01454 [Acorus calamus]
MEGGGAVGGGELSSASSLEFVKPMNGDWVLSQWMRSTLLCIQGTLWKTIFDLRIDLDKLLDQSQENVDQVLDLDFTLPWTIQFQTALGKFESDLAVVKLLMNPCLKELGREYLDQELGGYDRWRPNALLPTVKDSLEFRRDWVAEAMTDCWSYVRSEINYLLPQFPRVHEYGDGSDFEVGFDAFMVSVNIFENITRKVREGLGNIVDVVSGGLGGAHDGHAGDGGGRGGGRVNSKGYTFKKPISVGYLRLFKVKKTRMDEGGGGGSGGGENERTIQEWVADKRKQSTLPFVRHTLWDAVLSFDARVEGLQQFFNLNSNHEVLHESFITLWIMGFQDALDRFNPVLEMMKRVIQSCLNGVGEEDLQHDLLVLEPHEPLPSPPKGEPRLELHQRWAKCVIMHSLLFTRHCIWSVFCEFPQEQERHVDEDLIAFGRCVSGYRYVETKMREDLGTLENVNAHLGLFEMVTHVPLQVGDGGNAGGRGGGGGGGGEGGEAGDGGGGGGSGGRGRRRRRWWLCSGGGGSRGGGGSDSTSSDEL